MLTGDSAGGTLTIATAMALRDAPVDVPVLVRAPIYPAADLGGDYPPFAQFAGGYLPTRDGMLRFGRHYAADVADPRASPMLGRLAGTT